MKIRMKKNKSAIRSKGSIVVLIVVFLSLVSSFFLIQSFGRKINPILYKYFNVEVKRFTNNVISNTINKAISGKDMDKLFSVTRNDKNEIIMLDYNTKEVNQLLEDISKGIEIRLTSIEEGDLADLTIGSAFRGAKFRVKNGIVCEVPMGLLWKNSFLANFGPVIPVKMAYIGYVNTNLDTKLKNYGINNVYLEVSIQVEVSGKITMPTGSKMSVIKIDAPLTIKLIQGNIPEYYYGGAFEKSSSMLQY